MNDSDLIPLRLLSVGRFAMIGTGKHIGKIGYRTESAFFVVEDPRTDFLNTASIFVRPLPEDYSMALRSFK